MEDINNPLGNIQKKIIDNVKSVYKKYSNDRNIDILDQKLYLNCWTEGLGKEYIKFYNGKKIAFFSIFLKRFFNYFYEKLIIYYPVNHKAFFNNTKVYRYICISWSIKKDFSEDGEYFDRYTNNSSRETKNVGWILMHLDKDIPTKIDDNVLILKKELLIKVLLNNLLFNKYSFERKYLNKIIFLKKGLVGFKKFIIFSFYIDKILKKNQIKKIFTPYEAQPYQLGLNKFIHNYYPEILTIGYIHSALPPLPTEYIFREGSPKILITHGSTQKDILTRLLNWEEKIILNTQSLRYSGKKIELLANCIYLPYFLDNNNLIIKEFSKLIDIIHEEIDIKNIKIRNHPIMRNSFKHIELINRLDQIIFKYSRSFKGKQTLFCNTAIVIGASAVVIELIELGYSVYHITLSPEFDVYSSDIWQDIDVTEISKNIYLYKIIKKSNLINRSNKKIKIQNLLEKIFI